MKPVPCSAAEVEHSAEHQAARKSDAKRDRRNQGRGRDEDRELIELRGIERAADAAGGMADETEQRQSGRQADRDDHHARGLHDGDGAHVGVEFGGQPHHLRQAAGRRGEIGGHGIATVERAQVGGAGDADAGHGHDQRRDAQRIGGDAVERRRRDHRAERDADRHQKNTHQRRRHHHRPPGQRRGGHHQNRAREEAGRHAEHAEGQAAGGGKGERFRQMAGQNNAIDGGRRGQGWRLSRNSRCLPDNATCSGHCDLKQGKILSLPGLSPASERACCKVGSSSQLRLAISACCSWWRATATAAAGSAAARAATAGPGC